MQSAPGTLSRLFLQQHLQCRSRTRMNYCPACHVCKTAYISAVNRMRCESCTDPKHQLRDPGQGLYQPCLIPGMTECGKWSQLKRWWDDLPRPEAMKVLQGSTRFGRFYLQLESHVLQQLVAAGCSDVDTLARHPLVLQSTPDQAPSATYVVAAGLAIVAASLTCSNGIPSAEEMFKWLVYASEGTCLRTRPHGGAVEESCLRNPREWPAALASSLEATILAVCPAHIACWHVASAEVLLQPETVGPATSNEVGRRTRRSRKSSKKKAQGAGTVCEARCNGVDQQRNLLSQPGAKQFTCSRQGVNSMLQELGHGGVRHNPLYCAQPSAAALDSFAMNSAGCGGLAEAFLGKTTSTCCGDTIAAVHGAHELASSRDHQPSMHKTELHRWSDSRCPAEQRALSDSPVLTIMSAETASKMETTTQWSSSVDHFMSGQSSVEDLASPRTSDMLR